MHLSPSFIGSSWKCTLRFMPCVCFWPFWRCMSDLSLDHNLEHPFRDVVRGSGVWGPSLERLNGKGGEKQRSCKFQKPKGQPPGHWGSKYYWKSVYCGRGTRSPWALEGILLRVCCKAGKPALAKEGGRRLTCWCSANPQDFRHISCFTEPQVINLWRLDLKSKHVNWQASSSHGAFVKKKNLYMSMLWTKSHLYSILIF